MPPSVTAQVIALQGSVTQESISPEGNSRHHCAVDDIYAIRRKNLEWIYVHKTESNQSALARDLELAASLVNRYLNEKNIGDDIARQVEAKYELAFGWMDNVHPSDRESLLLEAFRNAEDPVKRAIEGAAGISPFGNPGQSQLEETNRIS